MNIYFKALPFGILITVIVLGAIHFGSITTVGL